MFHGEHIAHHLFAIHDDLLVPALYRGVPRFTRNSKDPPDDRARADYPAARAEGCSTIHTSARTRQIPKCRVRPERTPGTSIHSTPGNTPGEGGPERMMSPPGTTSLDTIDRSASGSPAHRITATSKELAASSTKLSARPPRTRTPVSPKSRTASERNDARRPRDSMSVTCMSGRTILTGIPGNPAPDPMSAAEVASAGRTRKNSRLSRNRFSTTHSGSVEPTSRCTRCHFCSSWRYLANDSSS